MLYNKSAVKRKMPVTTEQIKLARAYSPFKLKKSEIEEIVEDIHIRKRASYFSIMENVANGLYQRLQYADKKDHYFEGCRTASEVWRDKQGHCIEKNVLFYAIVSKLGVKTKWLVTKNPKGYEGDGLNEIGVHPFLTLKRRGKCYLADAIDGTAIEKTNGFCIAEQLLSQREFIAFFIQNAAEDFGTNHNKYKKALQLLRIARKIDPNNYTIHVTIGDMFRNIGCKKADKIAYAKAEQAYKQAVRMASDLLDPYKEYGDFLFETDENPKYAVRVYREAVKRETKDLEILHSLEKRLKSLGKTKLLKKVSDMKNRLMKSEELRRYFE